MRTGGNKNSGFTIVETLIVLAVTGMLTVSAMILIGGRQSKTEFQVAINNTQQRFQQIINETASGYFPNQNNFTCTINAANAPVIGGGTTSQGQNLGCIFLGKVVQAGVAPLGTAERLAIYPLAGNKLGTNIKGSFVSGGAQPTPVVPLEAYDNLDNGLSAVWMKYSTTAAVPTSLFGTNTSGAGFLAGDTSGKFAEVDTTTGGYKPGSQQLSLYAVIGTQVSPPTSEPAMQLQLNAAAGANLVNATYVAICFASGSTSQSGKLVIDGTRNLAVNLTIFGNTTCT